MAKCAKTAKLIKWVKLGILVFLQYKVILNAAKDIHTD